MSLVYDDVSVHEDFRENIHFLIGCFEKTGLESDKEDREYDFITDFLKSIEIEHRPYNRDDMRYLIKIVHPKGCYKTADGEDAPNEIRETIQSKLDESVEKIAEIEPSGSIDCLGYFQKRKQHLEWLLNTLDEAKYRSLENDTTSSFIPLRRMWETPMPEERLELEEVEVAEGPQMKIDNILDLADQIQNYDLRSKMDKMPRDEYIALVRSKAEIFESQIEKSEWFVAESFFVVENTLKQFITYLEWIVTRDYEENLTNFKAEVIRYIEVLLEKLHKKPLF